MSRPTVRLSLAPVALGVCLLSAGSAAWAQVAGEVEFSRGVGFAQTPGQAPRTLGKGLPLREGDRLTTSDGASAIIKLEDGTRMTVRPNSEMVIQQYQFKENADSNAMLMQLVRGGFRAVTGLISKNSPGAARVQTSTATIGIRGTDFDARLCARDCGTESDKVSEASRPNTVLASAKLVNLRGTAFAVDAANARRRLSDGGSIFPGEVVETGPATQALLAFRDDTRITLGSSTRFRVDNFVYDEANAGEGRFLASLLKGSVRALTGLIAKANNRNVAFSTSTATIGVRGSGADLSCFGPCAGEPSLDGTSGLSIFAWLGSWSLQQNGGAPGQNALQLLQAGQGLVITPTGVRVITTPPASEGQRPDGSTIPNNLFSKSDVKDNQEGLFVFVRDGHIEIKTAGEILQLGKGEAGGATTTGQTFRPLNIPKFIEFDKTVKPDNKNPGLTTLLADSKIGASKQCTF